MPGVQKRRRLEEDDRLIWRELERSGGVVFFRGHRLFVDQILKEALASPLVCKRLLELFRDPLVVPQEKRALKPLVAMVQAIWDVEHEEASVLGLPSVRSLTATCALHGTLPAPRSVLSIIEGRVR